MTVNVPDRFKAANAFWIGLGKIGLTPAAVLSQARVPVTVYDGKKNLVTTAQFFALWRAVGELSSDPAAGLKIATQIDVGNRPPSTMAAYYARDYRDALTRLARFKQLCTPEELQIKIGKDECLIEPMWQHAQEETPPLLTDAAFASFVELGRRGTGHPVNPKRVELKRPGSTKLISNARSNSERAGISSSSTRPISTGRSLPTTPSCLKCWTHNSTKL
jgi:hypothetical protein